MQVGEQFAAFPSFPVFEVLGKEDGDMGDRASGGDDDKLDLNAKKRKKAKKMTRRRSLRLRGWNLGLMLCRE